MTDQFSYSEKLEVMEEVLERWRSTLRSGSGGDHQLFLVLKAITADYRARDRERISRTAARMEQAINQANYGKQDITGYQPGHLRHIAEQLIGAWPVWRQAMEKFEQEATNGGEDRTEGSAGQGAS